MSQGRNARCANCRAEVSVSDSYADGSQINCGSCSVLLRIVRADGLRLVMADPMALQETLRQLRMDMARATRDLQTARASWGIGVNGLGLGVLYVVAKVALEQRLISRGLLLEALGISVVVGVLLELANYLFLAKRQAISRLTEELRLATVEQREIERKIRESSRR